MLLLFPTEILLQILNRSDRETLSELRLVNRRLKEIVTAALFEDLSIHYGLNYAIAQMRAVAQSPLRYHIKSIFIPSESFSRDNLRNRETSGGYPWSKPRSIAKHLQHIATSNRTVDTPWPWASLDADAQANIYTDALVGILNSCENLQEIVIAVGPSWSWSNSLQKWMADFSVRIFDVIAGLGVKRLNLLVPTVWCFAMLLGAKRTAIGLPDYYGPYGTFKSLTSLSITVHMRDTYSGMTGTAADIQRRTTNFMSDMPKLTSYSISNTIVDPRSGISVFPPLATCASLTSLSISAMCFKEKTVEEFKLLISSAPLITNLSMHEIFIVAADPVNGWEIQPSPDAVANDTTIIDNPELGSQVVYSYQLIDPPIISWTELFNFLQKTLPGLTRFSYGTLCYGRTFRGMTLKGGITPFVPFRGGYEGITDARPMKSVDGKGLVSPYRKDINALRDLRAEIERRRHSGRNGVVGIGLVEGQGDEEIPLQWHFPSPS